MTVPRECHVRPKCYVPMTVQRAERNPNGQWTVFLEIPDGEEGFIELRGGRKIVLKSIVLKVPHLLQTGKRTARKKLKQKVSDGTEYPRRDPGSGGAAGPEGVREGLG